MKYFRQFTKREEDWQKWRRQVQRLVSYRNYIMAAKAEDESISSETTENSQTAQKSTENLSYSELTPETKALIKNVVAFLPKDTRLEDFSTKNINNFSSSILPFLAVKDEFADKNPLDDFSSAVAKLQGHMKLMAGIKKNKEYLKAALKHRADALKYQDLIDRNIMTRHAIGAGKGGTYSFDDLNKNTQKFIDQICDALPKGTVNEDFDDSKIDQFLNKIPVDNYGKIFGIISEIEHKIEQSATWSKRTELIGKMQSGVNFIARIPFVHIVAIPLSLLLSVARQVTWAQAIKTNPTLGRKEADTQRKLEIGASVFSAITVAATVAAFIFPPAAPIALLIAAFGFVGNTVCSMRLAKSDLDLEIKSGTKDAASHNSRIKSKNGEITSALGAVAMGLSAVAAATVVAIGAAAVLATPVGWVIAGMGLLATAFSAASFVYAKVMNRKADLEEKQFLEQQSKDTKAGPGINATDLANAFKLDAKDKLEETKKQLAGLSDFYKEATAKPQMRERSTATAMGPLTFSDPKNTEQKLEKQEANTPVPSPQPQPLGKPEIETEEPKHPSASH